MLMKNLILINKQQGHHFGDLNKMVYYEKFKQRRKL